MVAMLVSVIVDGAPGGWFYLESVSSSDGERCPFAFVVELLHP